MSKHLFILLVALSGMFAAHAQQTTYTHNGKTYYVYPYQQEIEIPIRQFRMGVKQEEIIRRDSLNRGIDSVRVMPVKRPVKMPSGKNFKRFKKAFLEIRREHPGILVNFTLPLEHDIVPTLEPLPDGDYVQFYRDIPYVDAENVLRYRNDIIAGVFTLKDNKLNGYAYWLNSLGDTIKAGHFRDGLKEGPWFANEYSFSTFDPKDPKGKITVEKYLDGTYKDTAYTHAVYQNGLMHGPYAKSNGVFETETGFYTKGEASGEWREYGYKVIRQGIKTIYTDEPILVRRYSVPEKEVVGRSVIIRNSPIDMHQVSRVDFHLDDSYFDAFSNYYKLYELKEEEGLELPEEKNRSYPGEDYGEGMYYDDNGMASIGNLDFSYGRYDRVYRFNDRDYTRNQLIDSIGYVFQFDKIYEEYYQNGQLKLRFEVQDGKLVKEDTIFWDNGNPVSVINYLPETGGYEEKVFDYDNKLIYHRLYDAAGTFKKIVNEPKPRNKHLIDGKYFKANDYDRFFEYAHFDTLDYRLTNSELLYHSLWRFDTTTAFINRFDPTARTITIRGFAIDKTPVMDIDVEFGEDYENLSATEVYTVGKLKGRTIMNGAYVKPIYRGNSDPDTVPNRRARTWSRSFDLNSDFTLLYEDKPFTGKFNMTTHQDRFGLKTTDEEITVRYANGTRHEKELDKAYNSYVKKRRPNKLTPMMTTATLYNEEISQNLLYNILPFSNLLFDPVDDEFFIEEVDPYSYEDRGTRKLSERQAPAFDKTVEGQFLNGKPAGMWITKDQFGNITAKVPFVNGEVDGAVYYYRTAEPAKKEETEREYDRYGNRVNPLLKDSLPAERTYYLAKVCHYKNGILNGPFFEMDWLGDTLTKWNYRDGRLDGPTLERTKIAYTVANYEDGATDGITQTYLTIPGRDTTLLYDLNFQNGMLQGESKAYHLNGKMAKHGFFLTGEPIDDFEAFDTLGFRYQYVKFQFNQPVEEKIWEENQLSVRYEFDWRDSIYFNTRDIAGSTSLERMLYELGLEDDGYREPYYGRPSLVDKTGIDYVMTKYYPNDTVARHGEISKGKKTGCWMFWNYEGRKLYEIDYADTILQINDSVRFKSKGVMTLLDEKEQPICRSYVVEKIEKYDCSHTDHHEIRMLYTFWERDPSEHRINGYVKNYYDNGVLMNEGQVKDGLATGVWKFYDPYGSLNMVGEYVLGKRQGRWLSGDLSQVKYMGDICLNPNLPNLDEIMSYQEKLLDISVIYYQMTAVKKREYYGVNMNAGGPPENYYGEEGDMYIDEEMYYEYYEEE